MIDADEQAAFLNDVRAAARNAGLDLVVNARIDTYLVDTSRCDVEVPGSAGRLVADVVVRTERLINPHATANIGWRWVAFLKIRCAQHARTTLGLWACLEHLILIPHVLPDQG